MTSGKPVVLVVDDERAILQIYRDKLTREGFDVLLAEKGEAGVKTAQSKKPDIILLDILMPRLNGLDVLKQLKETDETKDIPVYLLTNLPEEAGGEKGRKLGAAGYLVKAKYDPQGVVDLLKAIVARQKGRV